MPNKDEQAAEHVSALLDLYPVDETDRQVMAQRGALHIFTALRDGNWRDAESWLQLVRLHIDDLRGLGDTDDGKK